MKETVLAPLHRALGARLVPFAGWNMPLLYGDIVSEHRAVRESAGLFDLGHMGRLRIRGPATWDLVRRVQTRDPEGMPLGRTRYGLVCEVDGGIIDDVLVSREEGGFLVVVNAGNREAVLELFRREARGLEVEIRDETDELGMIAVQGPQSRVILETAGLAPDIGYYCFTTVESPWGRVLVSRTGYTGELGFELLVPREETPPLWSHLLEVGREQGLVPCGLGARDTLRLEAGMPLYGHELRRDVNPFEAGLASSVRPHPTCIAAESLAAIRAAGPRRRLSGLEVEGRRIPRHGQPVMAGDRTVGSICSGTHSPTLGHNIATAMLAAEVALGEQPLVVDIRGHRAPARRAHLPFYRNQE
jgi:aminomethyltransferase